MGQYLFGVVAVSGFLVEGDVESGDGFMLAVVLQVFPGKPFVVSLFSRKGSGVDKVAQEAAGVVVDAVDEQQFACGQQDTVALDIALYGPYVRGIQKGQTAQLVGGGGVDIQWIGMQVAQLVEKKFLLGGGRLFISFFEPLLIDVLPLLLCHQRKGGGQQEQQCCEQGFQHVPSAFSSLHRVVISFCNKGCIMVGAISLRGSSTNRRRCIRGCGRVREGVCMTTSS